MKKHSYLFLADGFEEIEALATVDILRRANIKVDTVAITPEKMVRGAHGVTVEADTTIDAIDASQAMWLIMPGGLPGATYLHECEKLTAMLKAHHAAGGYIAAICASPAFVLAPLGILDGCEATGYPGTTAKCGNVKWRDTKVAVCGNIITGNGPASTIQFALAIVAKTTDNATAQQVGSGMLFYPSTPSSTCNPAAIF